MMAVADVLASLPRSDRRQAILHMERENKTFPEVLKEIPVHVGAPGAPVRAWRSREFLVQQFSDQDMVRLSINRTHIHPQTFCWVDGITWDDLQRLKSEAGFGDHEAVEIYPPDEYVVDVANIRHLWILPDRLPFSWGGR